MSNIKNILVKNKILKNSTDITIGGDTENLFFTEEFLTIYNDALEKSDCIINYIPNYIIKAKKITMPKIKGFAFAVDSATGRISNDDKDLKVEPITAEMKEINLSIMLGQSALTLQGVELQSYIANELVEYMKAAIHLRLKNELIALGRGEKGTYTAKWIEAYLKANAKGNSIIVMSDNIPGKVIGVDYQKGEYTIFGKKAIIVSSDYGFNGLLIVDKKAIDFYKCEDETAYIDEVNGNRKNVTYFGQISYCNFMVKNSEKCYYADFVD